MIPVDSSFCKYDKITIADFYVLLTMHLSIFILVINQHDAQNLFYNKFISFLYMFRAPCAHHQEAKVVLYSLWYHHTFRWPSRAQVERGLSLTLYIKHVEAWNKLTVKQILCIKLVNYWDNITIAGYVLFYDDWLVVRHNFINYTNYQ